MTGGRRLIEDHLLIQAIRKEASREKIVRKGYISTLLLSWARQPLFARRAAVCGVLVLITLPMGCASRDRLTRLQDENTDLREKLSSRDHEIAVLKADLRTLADKDASARLVLELRQSLDAKTAEYVEAAERLSALVHERQRLSTELGSARNEIAGLTKEIRTLNEIATDIDNPLVKVAIIEWKLAQELHGATLIAQDDEHTYLGLVDFAGAHVDSIFNDHGLHGSKFGLESIWNNVGFYGSTVGLYSAQNNVCINPPMLVKNRQILGYVTKNKVYAGAPRFDPHYLLNLARRIQGRIGE